MDLPEGDSPTRPPKRPRTTPLNLNLRQGSRFPPPPPLPPPQPSQQPRRPVIYTIRERVIHTDKKDFKDLVIRLTGLVTPSSGASSSKSPAKNKNAAEKDVAILEGTGFVPGNLSIRTNSGPPTPLNTTSLMFFDDFMPESNLLPTIPCCTADSLSTSGDLSVLYQSNSLVSNMMPHSNLIPQIPPIYFSSPYGPPSLSFHDSSRTRNYTAGTFLQPPFSGASSSESPAKNKNAAEEDVIVVEETGSVPGILSTGPNSVSSIPSDTTSLMFLDDCMPSSNSLPTVPCSTADSLSSSSELSFSYLNNSVASNLMPHSNLIPQIRPSHFSPQDDPSSLSFHDSSRNRNYTAGTFLPGSNSLPGNPSTDIGSLSSFSNLSPFDQGNNVPSNMILPSTLIPRIRPNFFPPQNDSSTLINRNLMTGNVMPGTSSTPEMPQNSLLQQFDPNSLSTDSTPDFNHKRNDSVENPTLPFKHSSRRKELS